MFWDWVISHRYLITIAVGLIFQIFAVVLFAWETLLPVRESDYWENTKEGQVVYRAVKHTNAKVESQIRGKRNVKWGIVLVAIGIALQFVSALW